MNSKGRKSPPNLAGPRHRTIAGDDRGTIKSMVNSPRDEIGFHSIQDRKQNRNYSTSNNGAYSRSKGGMPSNLAGPRHCTIAGDDCGTIKSVVNSPVNSLRDEMGLHSN